MSAVAQRLSHQAAHRLSGWAAQHELLPAGTPLEVERLAGGSSNLTYRVRVAGGGTGGPDWVLRRPPESGVLPTAHDMAREWRVQRALGEVGFPVPGMVALCEDTAVLGAPFYLMERLDGVFHADGHAVAALPAATVRQAGEELAVTLARLHAVDPVAAGLGGMVREEPYGRRQLRRWRGQWERSRIDSIVGLDALLDRLDAALPPAGDVAVVHGDYNLANVMYRPQEQGRVLAVLDWEMATVGDAVADLGQLLAYWGPAGRLLFAGRGGHLPDANPALPGPRDLVEAYARARGETPEQQALLFWETFAVVKLAIICSGALARGGPGAAERIPAVVAALTEVAEQSAARLVRRSEA